MTEGSFQLFIPLVHFLFKVLDPGIGRTQLFFEGANISVRLVQLILETGLFGVQFVDLVWNSKFVVDTCNIKSRL